MDKGADRIIPLVVVLDPVAAWPQPDLAVRQAAEAASRTAEYLTWLLRSGMITRDEARSILGI